MPKLKLPNIENVVAIDIHTHAEEPCGMHGDDGGICEFRHRPPSRSKTRQIPRIFRALAFSTFGRISSRISILEKSDSQRSGVMTGQSEPNSILS